MLFMPERYDPDTFSLCQAAKIRNWDARYAIDRVDVIELECIDDEVKAVRQ